MQLHSSRSVDLEEIKRQSLILSYSKLGTIEWNTSLLCVCRHRNDTHRINND